MFDELHPDDREDEQLYTLYNIQYVPRIPPDELHPDDGEDEEQAGDDQHLLQQTVNS